MITFTKPVAFKTGSVPFVMGSSYAYYKTKLSSGLGLVGIVYTVVLGSGWNQSIVHLYEDVLDAYGGYSKVYGSIGGYNCNTVEEALIKLGFTEESSNTVFFWGDWADPSVPTPRSPVAIKQRCKCGFETDYEIICEGTYTCKACLYWTDAYGKKK